MSSPAHAAADLFGDLTPGELQMPLATLLKGSSKFFVAALLVAFAGSVAGPNPALAAAPQHHDQVPGFYRMKVGDLEVTALFDGAGAFDLHWLNGKKGTMDRI